MHFLKCKHQIFVISHSHNIHNTGLKKCYYKGSITWGSATTWWTASLKRYEEELFSVMWLVPPRLVQLVEAGTRLAKIFLFSFLRIFRPDSEVLSQSSVLTKNWGMTLSNTVLIHFNSWHFVATIALKMLLQICWRGQSASCDRLASLSPWSEWSSPG